MLDVDAVPANLGEQGLSERPPQGFWLTFCNVFRRACSVGGRCGRWSRRPRLEAVAAEAAGRGGPAVGRRGRAPGVSLFCRLSVMTFDDSGLAGCISRAVLCVLEGLPVLGVTAQQASDRALLLLSPKARVEDPNSPHNATTLLPQVNWSGTHEVSPRRLYEPESLEQLEKLVAHHHRTGDTVCQLEHARPCLRTCNISHAPRTRSTSQTAPCRHHGSYKPTYSLPFITQPDRDQLILGVPSSIRFVFAVRRRSACRWLASIRSKGASW